MIYSKQDVIDYYETNSLAYRLWGENMHYGYWDESVKNQRQASKRYNEVLASIVNLSSADHVLDAGCGVGGSSIFLAKTYGCKVTGITLSLLQVENARKNAIKQRVAHLCDFVQMDFENMTFQDQSFSVVWGMESVCHADNKRLFIENAFRVLQKNGRLIISDGFASRNHYEGNDAKLMRRWLDAWIINHLNTANEWVEFAKDSGFTDISYKDVTRFVLKTSKLMFWISMPLFPLHLLDNFIQFSHPTDAAYYQYFSLKKNLWQHGIFYSKK